MGDAVRTAVSHCPHCSYRVDAATSVTVPGATPKEGDYAICVRCRGLSVFRADQSRREPTQAELDRFIEANRQIACALNLAELVKG